MIFGPKISETKSSALLSLTTSRQISEISAGEVILLTAGVSGECVVGSRSNRGLPSMILPKGSLCFLLSSTHLDSSEFSDASCSLVMAFSKKR